MGTTKTYHDASSISRTPRGTSDDEESQHLDNSNCDATVNELPGHKTDGDLRSPLISLECIDWEQALNVELLRRMQAIHKKLEKRRAEYQRQSGSNPFLPALTAAMGAWLGELEAAAIASEEDIARFGAS